MGCTVKSERSGSEALELRDSPFANDITRIQGGFGLDQNYFDIIVLGNRAMLHAARHGDELAFAHNLVAIAEFHPHLPFHYPEQFIFVVVVMPQELYFEPYGFKVAIINLGDDARLPVIRKMAELFLEIYGFHEHPPHPHKSSTSWLTAVRTRRVVSGLEVSEYTRKRFSVPDARTITPPISPKYNFISSRFSRCGTRPSSNFLSLPSGKCA